MLRFKAGPVAGAAEEGHDAVDASGPLPAVVGHRGFPGQEPENTPASFQAAADAGATWVELDARRCADGVVVHHDPHTSDGMPVLERTTSQLVTLGVWSLDAVLAMLPDGIGVDVEVKNLPFEPDHDPHDTIVSAIAPLLTAEATRRPVCATSFNPRTVGALVAALPSLTAGLVTTRILRLRSAVRLARRLGCGLLCPAVASAGLDAAFVQVAHDAGLALMPWTVDDPDRARALARIGVDALCTNYPDRIVAVLRDDDPLHSPAP